MSRASQHSTADYFCITLACAVTHARAGELFMAGYMFGIASCELGQMPASLARKADQLRIAFVHAMAAYS